MTVHIFLSFSRLGDSLDDEKSMKEFQTLF